MSESKSQMIRKKMQRGDEPYETDEVSASSSNALLVRKLQNTYTEKRKIAVEDCPGAHDVWLVVGVQSFCVTPAGCETKDEAELMQKMLATAISKIIEEH